MSTGKHTPGQVCDECEGFCLQPVAPMHTQGDWVVDEDDVNAHGNLVGIYIAHAASRGRIGKVFGNCLVTTDAELRANAALFAAAPKLLQAVEAALAYDRAIQACADSPSRLSSFCTAEGDDLDTLYARWIHAARVAHAQATGSGT